MSLSPDDIKALVDSFEASGWDEMSVRFGDTSLDLTRTGAPPRKESAAAVAAAANGAPVPLRIRRPIGW